MNWQRYLKVTLTRARQLSRLDFDERQGVIRTREGDAPFRASDYVALDRFGEYPIGEATIQAQYTRHGSDEAGYTLFLPIEPLQAVQLHEAFSTDRGVTGQPGDYLLRGRDGRTWPCARAKFEQEYRLLQHNLVYSIGYLNPGALDLLQMRVNNGALIVDIRLVAASRYRPEFSAKRLRARFKEAYLRLRDLGNDHYNQPDAPIVLHNPEAGVPQLLALLEHQDICLLCRCQRFAHCHSALVVAELQRIHPDLQMIRIGEEMK